MKYLLAISIISTLIMSCSSSGGDNSNSVTDSSKNTEVSEIKELNTPPMEEDDLNTASLTVDPDFKFNHSSELQVNILLNDATTASLKICRVDENKEITTDNCILSTRITNSNYQNTLAVGSDISNLGMQVIIIDKLVEIQNYYWSRNDDMLWDVDI